MPDIPNTPINIFISYAHADSAFVDRLEADLQKQGFDPWVDRQRLKGGQRWRRELQAAVKRAQVLMIVLSPDAISSDNVQIEYDYVLELGKVVIPLYLRQCEVPMELRAIQWIDFRHSYNEGLAALLDVLHLQQVQVAANSSPQENAAHLPEVHPATTATSKADIARSQVGQQPAASSKLEPLWKVPSTFTPLVGREQEVAEISALLTQPEIRLVTLIGPGGIGKTRLGIAVAMHLRSIFSGGTCFVGLAVISDPQLVVPAIAQELGLKERGTQSPLQQVQALVGEQPFLLVLDNFEQVVVVAQEIEELLAVCPGLKMLVTSRAVLHLSAEQVVSVAPLGLPDLSAPFSPEGIAQSAAVNLFVQRARSQLPNFQLTPTNAQDIAEVCVRLDGLPLAIELAAARIRLLPPQTLLTHLSQSLQVLTGSARSAPARQQTLRNTIQWSYDLLGKEEQALFRLLSVFVGGWTLEAVEAVNQGAGYDHTEVLNTLASLLDNSLIQQSAPEAAEPRFQMLQTVREYGLELLAESKEREVTQATHARYFLKLAEQAEPELDGPNQTVWLERLEQEHDNLRAALEWTLQEGTDDKAQERKELVLRLSAALGPFWAMHGHYNEARTFLERVLASSEGESDSLRARVLQATAEIAKLQGDYDRTEALAQQSLDLYRKLENTRGIDNALFLLAEVAGSKGKAAETLVLTEERVRLLRQIGEPGEIANALFSLAEEVSLQGEYIRGQSLFEEALLLFRKAGNELMVGATLAWSAFFLLWSASGDMTTVRQRFQEGQILITKVGHRPLIANTSSLAALIALAEGESGRAYKLAQESLTIYQELGYRRFLPLALYVLGRVEAQLGDQKAAHSRYMESLAIAQELGNKWVIPFDLEGLASVLSTQGESKGAAQLWGAAEVLHEATAYPQPAIDRPGYERAVAAARAHLGEQAFAAAWQEGRTMELEEVIDDALKRGDEGGRQ